MLSSINFRNYKRAVKMSICHEVKKKKKKHVVGYGYYVRCKFCQWIYE